MKRALIAAFLMTSVLTVAGQHRSEQAAAAPAGWDAAAAARYLDSRMNAWWSNAKTLKTGNGTTRCLSCHTAVPYVLARPALRRVLGEQVRTAHEDRIVETARARIRSSDTAQPFYDQNDGKIIESRGVEAVLNAFVLAQRDSEGEEGEPTAETRAAFARLWAVQRSDGAWDWLDFGLEPYEAPDSAFHGAMLAGIAAGTRAGSLASSDPAGRAALERLRTYTNARLSTQHLFNRAWALVAGSRLSGLISPAQRSAIVSELEARQGADGGWSLTGLGPWRWGRTEVPFSGPGPVDGALLGASDGYATGLVVYALKQSGVEDASSAVSRGRQWLRSHEVPEARGDAAWAPWRAHSLNFDREHGGSKGEPWRRMFMSDLATAFAVLALTS